MSPHLHSSVGTSAAESEWTRGQHHEALKGIGVANNKLVQVHFEADNHNPGGSHLIGRGWSISHQRRAVGQGVSAVAGLLVADFAVDDDLARSPLAARLAPTANSP